jgi:hypothetical protein
MKYYVILSVFLFFLFTCTPAPEIETWVAATISVLDERLSLSPIVSEAKVEHLPDWPSDPTEQKILLKNFDAIWNRVHAEFRRCQKYGLYAMVDDNDNPTIRISIILSDVEMVNDSLHMPVRLQAERLRDDQRFIYTIPAKAWFSPEGRSAKPFHYYGHLLADYRRNFPYRDIVSFFYRHKLKEPS